MEIKFTNNYVAKKTGNIQLIVKNAFKRQNTSGSFYVKVKKYVSGICSQPKITSKAKHSEKKRTFKIQSKL